MAVSLFKIQKSENQGFKVQRFASNELYPSLHVHPEIQVTYIEQGEGIVSIGSYQEHYEKGDWYVIGANVPHFFKRNEDLEKRLGPYKSSSAIHIFIDIEMLKKTLFQLSSCERLANFFSQPRSCWKAKDLVLRDEPTLLVKKKGLSQLIQILDTLMSVKRAKELTPIETCYQPNEIMDKRLGTILDYVQDNYFREISLDEMSDVANMTKPSFCRFFKQRTGQKFIFFLNETRIKKACELLEKNDLSIKEVSMTVGFQTVTHFNKLFKKITNTTPKAYQSSLLN